MSSYSTRHTRVGYANCTGLPHNYERTQPFSISVWFKFQSNYAINNTLMTLIGNRLASGAFGWILSAPCQTGSNQIDGTLTFTLYGVGGGYLSAYVGYAGYPGYWNVKDGRWHHIVVTYSGNSLASGLHFYGDGVEILPRFPTETLTGSILAAVPTRLGFVSSYIGAMDEAAIWDKELSSVEAAWVWNGGDGANLLDVTAPSNLQSWWRMGEGSDTSLTLYDSGPLAAHASVVSNTCWGPLGSRSGAAGFLEAIPSSGGAAPTVITTYQKRARDLGSGPVFIEWTTTNINSAPPSPPPVGPWGEIVVAASWEQ